MKKYSAKPLACSLLSKFACYASNTRLVVLWNGVTTRMHIARNYVYATVPYVPSQISRSRYTKKSRQETLLIVCYDQSWVSSAIARPTSFISLKWGVIRFLMAFQTCIPWKRFVLQFWHHLPTARLGFHALWQVLNEQDEQKDSDGFFSSVCSRWHGSRQTHGHTEQLL